MRLLAAVLTSFLALDALAAPMFEEVVVAPASRHKHNAYPTVDRLGDGRLICVYSVQDEKATRNKAVVMGTFSTDNGRTWNEPTVLIDSPNEPDWDPHTMVIGDRLLVMSTTVPPTHAQFISTSRTVAVRSDDNGRTWSKPYEVPMPHRYTAGKIHRGIVLRDGTALWGYAWDANLEKDGKLQSEGQQEYLTGMMISTDKGLTWKAGEDISTRDRKITERTHAINGVDEPAVVELGDGTLYTLLRTGVTKLYEARSRDGGRTWSMPQPSPLTSHNAPAALCAFKGEKPGVLVVWNNSPTARWPLCAAASFDNAQSWTPPRQLATSPGLQVSYPGCVQAPDGTLIAVWQRERSDGGREIVAGRFNVDWLLADPNAELKQELAAIRAPETGQTTGWTGKQDPANAVPEWKVHAGGGKVMGDGTLRLEPSGAYYIDDRSSAWDGGRDKVVTFRVRVLDRSRDAVENHSAAEIWLGGSAPRTGCQLFLRKDAVSFDPGYGLFHKLDATRFHTYRIWIDLRGARACLFVDDAATPVLATALNSPEGLNLNRVLFGDSSMAGGVSGVSEWASFVWADAVPAREAGIKSPEWAVPELPYRVLLEVAPVKTGRETDSLAAAWELDFTAAPFTQLALEGRLDLDSMQVVGFDPGTGKPLGATEWPFARNKNERISRFIDKSLPWEFPTSEPRQPGAAVGTFTRGAYLNNAKGTGNPGLLVWDHEQKGSRASTYAVYFNTVPEGKRQAIPRHGFLGDGSPRRDARSSSLTGSLYNRVAVADWDGDADTDLIIGIGFGYVLLFRNEGDRTRPQFGAGEYLRNANGDILNGVAMASPDIADWNGDGKLDLVVGAETLESVLWYENTGTNTALKLVYRGYIKADGKDLVVPAKPNPESPHYTKDYAPGVDVVDWDDDGDQDLLLGGYITGYIWLYENIGREESGAPKLTFRGPIEADGKPIDTIWGAHPCAADFDSDGDLDLLTGSFGQAMGGGDQVSEFLIYYQNIGSRREPRFTRRPVPYQGSAPSDILAQARAVDFTDDGLLDLVISTMSNVYMAENVGNREAPRWKVVRLDTDWGLEPLSLTQFYDWNRDGRQDLVRSPLDGYGGPMIQIAKAGGTHGVFEPPQPLLPTGREIVHPHPYGDPWAFVYLCDFEQDGDADILWADAPGNVYLHRNTGAADTPGYDQKGERLLLESGEPIKVGPPVVPVHQIKDFVVMQGSRAAVTAADFDRDGDTDLCVGDTFGDVFYFENRGTSGKLVFAAPAKLGNISNRAIPSTYDWDADGLPDVLGVSWSGAMEWYRNRGPQAAPQFDPPRPFTLPPSVMYSPRVVVADWNRDGDDDFLVMSSYPWFCWLEGSYVRSGYAHARALVAEKRP